MRLRSFLSTLLLSATCLSANAFVGVAPTNILVDQQGFGTISLQNNSNAKVAFDIIVPEELQSHLTVSPKQVVLESGKSRVVRFKLDSVEELKKLGQSPRVVFMQTTETSFKSEDQSRVDFRLKLTMPVKYAQ